MNVLQVMVYGTPAPQGSKRHVGGGRLIESSQMVKPWREAVKYACLQAGAYPVTGPVRVDITFTLKKPTSAPKRRETWPTKRPDLDKLVRSTLDGLTEGGCWADDAQVVQLVARKAYVGSVALDVLPAPGAYILILALEPQPASGQGTRG